MELKQCRLPLRGRRLEKNGRKFYLLISQLPRTVQKAERSKALLKLKMYRQRSIPEVNSKISCRGSRFLK